MELLLQVVDLELLVLDGLLSRGGCIRVSVLAPEVLELRSVLLLYVLHVFFQGVGQAHLRPAVC